MTTEKSNILKNYPMPVTLEASNNIINQMKNFICKIVTENGEGTGFFCNIKNGSKDIHVLITTSTLVNDDILNKSIALEITINNNEEKSIRLKDRKNIYISNKYDITLIEIKPDEGITSFLDIDEDFLKECPSFDEEDGNIYILHYPIIKNEQKASVSYGKLDLISDGKLNYYCQTKPGSLGSPILKSSNNKVIGIHINNHFDTEQGIILQGAINEYLNDYIEPSQFGPENVNYKIEDIEKTQLGPVTGENNEKALSEIQLGPEVIESTVHNKEGNDLNNKNDGSQIIGELIQINPKTISNNTNSNNIFFDKNENIYVNKTNSFINDNSIINNENNNKDEEKEKEKIKSSLFEVDNLSYFDNNQINLQNNMLEEINKNNINKQFSSKSINNNKYNLNEYNENSFKTEYNDNKNLMSCSSPSFNNQLYNIQNNNQEINRNTMIYSNEKNENYSFSRYKKASTTGLKNLGDISYLNSVLYLLGNIRPFASYFLNPKNAFTININKDNSYLSFLISRLYYHLYPYPEKPDREIYQPKLILDYLCLLNINKNPCDIIKNILMILHNELNEYKNNNKKLIPNYWSKESVLKCEVQNFQNSNKSIISDKLNWFELRRTICNSCKYKIYNFLSFNHIELDIKECYTSLKKTLTINDCLQYKSLSKKQYLKCNNCGDNSNIYSYSGLYLTPEMIIFTLERGNSGQNINIIPFFIHESIDLSDLIEIKDRKYKYQLNGIVYLITKENNFNYVSYCKSPVDQQWYKYEDENIFPTKISEAININNNNINMNIRTTSIPFILVYKYN